ncbi:MAG: cache domain-containing protein [Rubrivivax sp.]
MDEHDVTVVRPLPATDADSDATVVRPVVARRRPPPRPQPVPPPLPAAPAPAPSAAAAPADDSDATVVRQAIVRDSDGTVTRLDGTLTRLPGAHAIARALGDRTTTRVPGDRTVTRVPGDRTVTRVPGTPLRGVAPRNLALPAQTRLHEYRIEGVLGQGGFGITYLATDANLDAKVAIKEYLPQEIAFRAGDHSVAPNASQHRDRYRQGLENFLTEARTLASLRHPNIVRVARFFEAHHTAYMVLEYERGQSFKLWWPQQKHDGGKGERLLVARLQPLLDGLSTVHAAGYLHRDIKPDNIQVRDEDGRLVLLDFGSAGQALALADQDAVVVTPGYAPIEQYGVGEQGAWTDIYALGATLYWAVTGHKPPDAEERAGGAPLTPATQAAAGRYGRAFLEAIDWALQLQPEARPQSIDAWRDRLLADHSTTLGLREALRRDDTRQREAADPQRRTHWRAGVSGLWARLGSPSAWPLAAKLALAMLVTALAPMLVTGLYNLNGALGALQDTQLRKTELMAHNTAGRVGQLLSSSAHLARGLGGDAELARWLSAPNEDGLEVLQQRLAALSKANPDIHFVMVMDGMGGVRVSTDRDLLGRNFAFREYFKEASAGRPYTTGIVVGAAAGAAGVFFAEPVRDAAGNVLGAVVLRVRASAFAAILDEVRHDVSLTPFMVDGDGVVVHHPRSEMMYRSLMPLADEVQQRIKADQRFRRDRVESLDEPELAAAMTGVRQAGYVAYRSRSSGVDEIAGFAPVPGQTWTVGVSQTREAFEKPLSRLMTHLQLSVALVGLLFVAAGLLFARGIVRPVQQLTRGADELKAGRFEQAYVDVKSRDELGQLARTFNVMVDVLRQREREHESRKGA